MRGVTRSCLLVVVLSAIAAGAGAAQGGDLVVRPGGQIGTEYKARQCDSHRIEMIDARSAADTPGVPHSYLDRASKAIFFYFAPQPASPPRLAIARVAVRRDGSLSPASLETRSGDAAFDAALTQALDEAGRAGVLAVPAEVTQDSVLLDVVAGQKQGSTKPYLEKRTVCPAWPKSGNPQPDYPAQERSQGIRGVVTAQFMVTVDGRVKPETFQVIQSSDASFTEAVRDILSALRYEPAEVMGKKVEQLTRQTFSFGFNDRPTPY